MTLTCAPGETWCDGIPVHKDPHVPLTRRKKDGSVVPALCWQIDGRILVHPDRWAMFVEAFGLADEVEARC